MTIVRRRITPRPPTWQQRALQLERELSDAAGKHQAEVGRLGAELLAAIAQRAERDTQILIRDRQVAGLREQLLRARRDLVGVLRAHGAGDQVHDDPDVP